MSFEVDEMTKFTISKGPSFLKAKCDKIVKVGKMWLVEHHLNKLMLLVAKSLEEVTEFGRLTEVDFNSSFEDNNQQST